MSPLDVLNCPLDGVNLIEASAGTGKTWTIAALYTRLLLEPDAVGSVPNIDQVLVVTYTKAATAELRARLRQRLHELSLVLAGKASDDPFLLAMAERHPPGALRAAAEARLNVALAGFDTAAIYTIHGFCQRALTDAAFESGQSFSAELMQDDSERLLSAADDFWRRQVVHDELLARVLSTRGETPDAWLAQVRPFLAKPYLKVDRPDAGGLTRASARLDQDWRALARDSESCLAALQCLLETKGMNARSYGPEHQAKLRQCLTALLATPERVPSLTRDERQLLDKLTPTALAKGANKGFSAPEHPAFARVADWLAAWDAYALAVELEVTRLKLDLIDWIAEEMARRRQDERKRSFDDLLTDLDAALSEPERGPALARQLAASFKVALIDEFQDTDPIQYHIFQSCFVAEQRPVFLVGDPKQAIYSFRGADIFAYLAAREDAVHRYTLDSNRRSQAPLVASVNALFARPEPFVLPEISFQPVAAQAASDQRLEIDDDRAPFNWQWLDFTDSAKGASKQQAGKRAALSSAAEIARLLALARSGHASLVRAGARRPLCGGDIAVLVASHRQGDLIRQSLSDLNIPSVALTQDSVYASREAQELLQLLNAWAEPGNESRLRLALTTELIGWRADQLKRSQDDESGWEGLLAAHADDHQRWRERGFMAAWRQFFARQGLAQRLLPLPDGERRLTNLAHLAELLQKESETRGGMVPLLDWFQRQVSAPRAAEEAQLRLESDASLVKIATVHSAKGLQYAIVFCPFLWDGALERRDTVFWRSHRADGSWLTPDALVTDEVKQAASRELLAEKLRLAYVALTRAQHRQYVAWGWVQKMETAALSWLLHTAPSIALEDVTSLSAATVYTDLQRFSAALGAAARLLPEESAGPMAPDRPCDTPWAALKFPRALYTPWRVSSFTGLAQHGSPERERPDHDHGVLEPLPLETASGLLPFPRGARAGTCLHAILERIDFTAPRAEIQVAVQESVVSFGFDPACAPAASDLIERTLDAQLDPGVRLARVAPHKRLVELEFMLPVGRLQAGALIALLAAEEHGLDPALRQAAQGLNFKTLQGFLKGFIDLVFEADGCFYLVDYKSNYLGATQADYGPESLAQSIACEHYYLQYLIYSVALRRYLRSRGVDFDARFAGVRYLFMRGLDASGRGVWRDQPAPVLLDRLDSLLG